MSSPFSPETNRGTEETIEAIHRTAVWASRIDTKNDATGVDTDFVSELNEEEERLRLKHKIKNTEVALDNFVFNNTSVVLDILHGDLDDKVAGLHKVSDYVSDQFGYVSQPSLDKEELLWLISEEVRCQNDRLEEYEDISSDELDGLGNVPDLWSAEDFPIYNRS